MDKHKAWATMIVAPKLVGSLREQGLWFCTTLNPYSNQGVRLAVLYNIKSIINSKGARLAVLYNIKSIIKSTCPAV